MKTFILKAFLKRELLTGSHFVGHAYRKRCLHLHRQQNRNQEESLSSLVTFLSTLPLPSRSPPFPSCFLCGSRAFSRRRVGGLIAGAWGNFTERGGRGRKGRSLIIIITFTPFIISKHHHHQRDEACLRSPETYRNTKPAAAAAPNKMNRINRTPSPDAV